MLKGVNAIFNCFLSISKLMDLWKEGIPIIDVFRFLFQIPTNRNYQANEILQIIYIFRTTWTTCPKIFNIMQIFKLLNRSIKNVLVKILDKNQNSSHTPLIQANVQFFILHMFFGMRHHCWFWNKSFTTNFANVWSFPSV